MLMFLKVVITMGSVGLTPAQEVKLWRGIPNNPALAELQKGEGMEVDPNISRRHYFCQPHSCRGWIAFPFEFVTVATPSADPVPKGA